MTSIIEKTPTGADAQVLVAPRSTFTLDRCVDQKAAEPWQCPVCLELRDKDLLELAPCHHICCERCWNRWGATCPVCRRTVTATREAGTLRKWIGALTVCCTENECTARVTINRWADHEAACSWMPRPCPHGCGVQMRAADVASHVCPKAPTDCKSCGEQLPLDAYTAHLTPDGCSHTVACPRQCSALRVPRRHLLRHLGSECDARLIECGVCDQKVPVGQLTKHLVDSAADHAKQMLLRASTSERLTEAYLMKCKPETDAVLWQRMERGCCSAEFVGKEFWKQPFFHCQTCWPGREDFGACATCIHVCHDGHVVSFVSAAPTGGSFCDCGTDFRATHCRVRRGTGDAAGDSKSTTAKRTPEAFMGPDAPLAYEWIYAQLHSGGKTLASLGGRDTPPQLVEQAVAYMETIGLVVRHGETVTALPKKPGLL